MRRTDRATVPLDRTWAAMRNSRPAGALLVVAVVLIISACSTALLDRADVPQPPPEDCAADHYLFAGRSTMRTLGLVGRSRAPLPEPDRPAMIWVTADLLPFDAGPEGGEQEMTRMLCFTFDDGSGGSEWPVDEAWLPPNVLSATREAAPAGLLLLVAVGSLIVAVVSFIGFRRR